ncbi:bifunctional diguanylate cyclase/phosphodiesterase [Lysobacter sp. D1-1-M9]|uniref:bifunctional diguanylate cyclase/phosphodiesterase n=1 Tax=Novilysobacter longmucuonensis TaxID=3098603 RepID=UPI002FC98E15
MSAEGTAARSRLFGFQAKVLALLALALLATLAATLVVVNLAVDRAVGARLDHDLAVGERVWESYYTTRRDQLSDSVAVLADDFGFRAAVATGDEATVVSALANHGQRIGASLGLLLDPAGDVLASDLVGSRAGQSSALSPLHARAERAGSAAGVVVLQERLYLMAMVPINAPTRVGWVAMGRELDDAFAIEFLGLAGLHLALVRDGGNAAHAIDASSLPRAARIALAQAAPLRDAAGGRRSGKTRLDLDGAGFALLPTIAHGDSGAVRVLLLAARDEVVAPFRRLERQIIGLSAAAALLALIVATLIGRGVSRPVAQLAQAARRIETGDYHQPLPALGRDELGELAVAFNRMQAGIAEREQHILHQARHDGLTNLPNRGQALVEMQALIERARGRALDTSCAATSCAVIMLDLDRFRQINDTLGHDCGDEVLVVVAGLLRGALRGDDLLARLGGDEFMVVLEDVDTGFALERARALVETLRAPLRLSGTQVSLDVSVGVSMYPEHGDTPDMLLRRADIAMYEAKDVHAGVVLYQSGHDEVHLRQLTLVADLRLAFSRGELSMVFQPKIELASGRVAHAEALIRWAHPHFGWVRPDEFVPLAERTGLIHELTRFVLDRSLQQQRLWLDQGMDIALAVNISSIDLLDSGFPEVVLGMLALHGVAPGKLIIEITESTLMRDINAAIKVLQRLREHGVRLSIDDFGTGHSSLAQLRRLPVDEIKIDKSFVTGLTEGSDGAVIVRSAIEIGHNMGLRVIAEGVETAGSLALLQRYGCDMAQGFLFTAPLCAPGFIDWCERYAETAAVTA